MRETLGRLFGYIVIFVICWLLIWAGTGYAVGAYDPREWPSGLRTAHLVLSTGLWATFCAGGLQSLWRTIW